MLCSIFMHTDSKNMTVSKIKREIKGDKELTKAIVNGKLHIIKYSYIYTLTRAY